MGTSLHYSIMLPLDGPDHTVDSLRMLKDERDEIDFPMVCDRTAFRVPRTKKCRVHFTDDKKASAQRYLESWIRDLELGEEECSRIIKVQLHNGTASLVGCVPIGMPYNSGQRISFCGSYTVVEPPELTQDFSVDYIEFQTEEQER